MTSLLDYVALSAIVYDDNRSNFNKLPDPPPRLDTNPF